MKIDELIIGEKVRLDIGFNNSSIVEILDFTPKKIYAEIKADDNYTWWVMANRLTKLLNRNK